MKKRSVRDFSYRIDEYMYNCRSRKLRPLCPHPLLDKEIRPIAQSRNVCRSEYLLYGAHIKSFAFYIGMLCVFGAMHPN